MGKASQFGVRLMRDLRSLQEEPPAGICGGPVHDNILSWSTIVYGNSGRFKLSLQFTEEYPNKPPEARLISPMFHPNVYGDGGICLELLRDKWDPSYDVVGILFIIQMLLFNPYPNSPANSKAADLFCQNKPEYNRKVLQIVALSLKED